MTNEPAQLPPKELLDRAISFAGAVAGKRVAYLRRRHPDADTAKLVKLLDRDLISTLTGQGVGTGAAAAVPGFGTGAALALSGGEAAFTLNWSAVYVLALAEVHDVELHEVERRKTLLMTVLLGNSAQAAAAKVADRTGKHWSKKIIQKVPAGALRGINSVMGRNFVTRQGTKQGIIVLGKVVPFGVGAVIGGVMNFGAATAIVKSAHRVFEIEAPSEDPIVTEDFTNAS